MIGAGRSSRIPLLIAAVASGTAGWMGFNHTISAITLDTLASLPASTEEADPRIVIVEIDDASLDALGERWPIARSTWARLLKRLDGFGPRSIGIDAVFAEPSDSSAQRLVAQLRPESSDTLQQQLDGLGDLIAPDEALAEVLGSSDRFVLGTFLSESGVPSPAPVTQTLPRGLGPMASQFDRGPNPSKRF
ncbi:MAG: CHASE2 domain-containing protein, partial [Myxococcota bacterium]